MRSERWYWLLGFCGLSVCIHLGLIFRSHPFFTPAAAPRTMEIEVALLSRAGMETTVGPKQQVASQRGGARQTGALSGLKGTGQPRKPLKPSGVASANKTVKGPGGLNRLREEKPLPLGLPTGQRGLDAPRLPRDGRAIASVGGGGSLSPGPQPGGHDGSAAPESMAEDVIFHQGGAGGKNLPHETPGIGGGGGRSVLSVTNPLAKDAGPAEKPGAGPGKDQGVGAGVGGGTGGARGTGIGARPDGSHEPATLSQTSGAGVGAAAGAGIGTHAPGGGRGNGAELPGAGGSGAGYGKGNGSGTGPGTGVGVTDGPTGLTRGIPFGDVAGLPRGDPNGGGGAGGGPGGPGGRVVVRTVPHPGSGGGSHIHIVYLLDTSGSMSDGNKIGKAKQALKKALAELQPADSFDVINFDKQIHYFAPDLLPATLPNILNARNYVEGIRLEDWTFLSGALEAALSMQGVTHIFVLSDGEPHGGIEDFGQLLAMVRERNRRHVQINTLALGLGEKFKGMALLKALAEENNGDYSYINLAK